MNDMYEQDPRDYAWVLIQEGLVNPRHLLLCALKFMSHDQTRSMLDANELSPRFLFPEENEVGND